jgi:hypothetical protein
VNDVLLVRGFEPLRELTSQIEGFLQIDGTPLQAVGQVLSLDEFHDQEDFAVDLFESVKSRDVRVMQ